MVPEAASDVLNVEIYVLSPLRDRAHVTGFVEKYGNGKALAEDFTFYVPGGDAVIVEDMLEAISFATEEKQALGAMYLDSDKLPRPTLFFTKDEQVIYGLQLTGHGPCPSVEEIEKALLQLATDYSAKSGYALQESPPSYEDSAAFLTTGKTAGLPCITDGKLNPWPRKKPYIGPVIMTWG